MKHFASAVPGPSPTRQLTLRSGLLRVVAVALFFVGAWLPGVVIAVADARDPPGYQLGRGYALPQLDLTLGGYASVRFGAVQHRPWRVELGDLSLFTTWLPHPRLRLFSELEISQALSLSTGRVSTRDAEFLIERLYVDFLLAPESTLRLGKFLTPVGRWNLVHADPLVWTTTRPFATEAWFPQHATGAMGHGTLLVADRELDYMVYGAADEALDPRRTEEHGENFAAGQHGARALDNGAGLQLRMHDASDTFQFAFSFLNFKARAEQSRKDLLGVDFLWFTHGAELSGEAVYRFDEAGREQDRWAGYLQAVAPMGHGLNAILRYEALSIPEPVGVAHIGIAGLAYRPLTGLVLKLEYRIGADAGQTAPDGLFSSVAVLF